MQAIIRSEFQDYTIIAIAHRLDTILDFDRVIVIGGGVVVEEGNPKELLMGSKKSHFKALYKDFNPSWTPDNVHPRPSNSEKEEKTFGNDTIEASP